VKIAILSYPMLFQRLGGLQVQVRETTAALCDLGLDARVFDINAEKLGDYDIVHVFAAINGVHRIVEAAKDAGKPVVVSSVLHGDDAWMGDFRARLASRITGWITGWEYSTTYDHIRLVLARADRVIALGRPEAAFIARRFGQGSEKIRIIPNGISPRFFTAESTPFTNTYGIKPGYVLCVASISPYKNQLAVVRATIDPPLPVVIIGRCSKQDKAYLEQCLREGGDRVQYVGPLAHDSPLLASAYAGAAVTVLASRTEVMPLTVLESLAAGTPAIVTRHNSFGFSAHPPLFAEVEPDDISSIRRAVDAALATVNPGETCRSLVRHLDWREVARRLAAVYEELLSRA
jgi:glycosyltransferase involved in cell wall biosynthesis